VIAYPDFCSAFQRATQNPPAINDTGSPEVSPRHDALPLCTTAHGLPFTELVDRQLLQGDEEILIGERFH
jgi:hypothetical protein